MATIVGRENKPHTHKKRSFPFYDHHGALIWPTSHKHTLAMNHGYDKDTDDTDSVPPPSMLSFLQASGLCPAVMASTNAVFQCCVHLSP